MLFKVSKKYIKSVREMQLKQATMFGINKRQNYKNYNNLRQREGLQIQSRML